MAIINNNPLVTGLQGAIGKQIVFRLRNGKTFVSKFPDMSNVKRTRNQKKGNSKFAEAVRYAQSIIRDPQKKAKVKVKKGQSVYHAAIKEFLARK